MPIKKTGALPDRVNRFIIVTGMSGAGKSSAINVFEDFGFFCVDNLPTVLILKFAEVVAQSAGAISKVALGIDVREREFLDNLFHGLNELSERQIHYEILFLEASDEVLLHRFSETRRRHPLDIDRKRYSVLEGIQKERQILAEIKARADKIIDTSGLTPKELREAIVQSFFNKTGPKTSLRINLVSFGYKYGLPLDADLIFDVRFLPNPQYREELKTYTGNDKKVRDFVLSFPATQKFLKKFFELVKFLIPYYVKEGKSYLTIAIGCTGGKHRSITVVNELERYLSDMPCDLNTQHRDINK